MAVSQSTFSTQHAKGREGQLGDSRPRNVESWIAGAAVNFGRAVVRSAEDKVTVGGSGTGGAPYPASNVVGISLKSPRVRPSDDNPTTYQSGTEVSVLTQGIVYVNAVTAVAQGSAVLVEATTGAFRGGTATAANRTLTGAVWMDTTSAANQVSRVKLNLP